MKEGRERVMDAILDKKVREGLSEVTSEWHPE